MTMNKAEKAEMEALRSARDMARALRWPEYAEPTPRTHDEIKANLTLEYKTSYGARGTCSPGWDFNSHTASVFAHWSTGNSQTTSNPVTADQRYTGWAQQGGRQFATRLEALRGLRLALTAQYAKQLAAIDALIADVDDDPTPSLSTDRNAA